MIRKGDTFTDSQGQKYVIKKITPDPEIALYEELRRNEILKEQLLIKNFRETIEENHARTNRRKCRR